MSASSCRSAQLPQQRLRGSSSSSSRRTPSPAAAWQHFWVDGAQPGVQRQARRQLAAPAAAAAAGDASSSGSSSGGSSGGLQRALTGLAQKHFLPLALSSAVVLGAAFPGAGVAATRLNIPAFVTISIFIVQGLQLRRKEAAAALSATGAVAYGLLSILLFTPLLGVLAVQLPLQPAALALGLGVFCAMPTALSSGVTFTQQVGGNVSMALMLTITSNILGIFTMPFILPHIVAAAPLAAAGGGLVTARLDPLPLLLQLCNTILLPTLIGACIRGFVPGAAAAVDARKKLMAYIAAGLLALVPWMQVSKAAAANVSISGAGVVAAAVAGVLIHVAFLSFNTMACRLLRIGGSDAAAARDVRRAVVLVSSVKTLPVAVTVLATLAPVAGEVAVGIAVVPCVLAHLAQIVWDSIMVSRWQAADAASSQGKAA